MIESLKISMYKILIFGDSIAAGRGVIKSKSWVSKLARYFDLKDKWNTIIYNLSIPGESSSELLERFTTESDLRIQPNLAQDKFVIIIAEGINDSKGVGSPENLKTSPDDLRKNILKIIKLAKQYTKALVFVGLTPVDEDKTAPTGDSYFLNKNIKKYNNIIRNICKKRNIHFMEIFDDWTRKDYRKFLSEDGIHPNEQGHQKIFGKIKSSIN